jgi:membrane-bound lytic murein transglycosylase B
MSARTGIPVVAVNAYATAQLTLARTEPSCHLSWSTLAAIGLVESNHGQEGGRVLGPDGRAAPAITGPALDGASGVALILDTDGGRLDGDATFDRAMGPMQFLPSTWLTWAVPAEPERPADPQNIADAALTAGRYLCATGGDQRTGPGWSVSVLAYNHSTDYLQRVQSAATTYALRSRGRT